MNEVKTIIKELESEGVFVFVESGKLKARTESVSLTTKQTQIIKKNKDALLAYLSEELTERNTNIKVSDDVSGPLSYSQQGLWFLDQLNEGSNKFNMFACFEVDGQFDFVKAQNCFIKLIERHHVLRTVYLDIEGSPKQFVLEHFDFEFQKQLVDIEEPSSLEPVLKNGCEVYSQQVFDLKRDLSIKVLHLEIEIVESESSHHYLLININHLAADGWSLNVLIKEFGQLYCNENIVLPELPHQYIDYANWQRCTEQQLYYSKLSTYWKEYLDGAPPHHSLRKKLLDISCPSETIDIQRNIGIEQSVALSEIAAHFDMSHFMMMHALVSLAICRSSNTNDVVMGTSVANRHMSTLDELMGLFANTVVFRTQTNLPTVSDYFKHVKLIQQGVQSHQELPFENILDVSNVRTKDKNPLFQIMLVNDTDFGFDTTLRNSNIELEGASLKRLAFKRQARYDLNIELNIVNGQYCFNWCFENRVFDRSYIGNIADQVVNLVDNLIKLKHKVLADVKVPLTQFHVHSEVSYLKLTESYKRLKRDEQILLHEMFESQVEQTPDKQCLKYSDKTLTFRQLNEHANKLARYISQHLHGDNEIVCICLERSIDIVVAELAVLKSGAAFVPVDPSLPADRVNYILNETESKVILTHQSLISELPVEGQIVVPMDEGIRTALTSGYEGSNLNLPLNDNSLAYIIYTSGSTGTPKGVLIEHINIVNQNKCEIADFGLDEMSRVLHCISFSFDPSIAHLFAPLNAGSMVFISENIEQIPDLIETQQITHASFPASVLTALELRDYPSLQLVTAGAEKCPKPVAVSWAVGRRFLYTYGPTETTVAASWGPLTHSSKANSIGFLLNNTYAHIVDIDDNLVPDGVEGELLIGGAGVARGYLKDKEKTDESFIIDPYAPCGSYRLYRTGDIVRRHENGELEFVGRKDSQIKLNGYRLELGEIESVIRSVYGVKRCHVQIMQDDRDFESLCAYIEVLDDSSEQIIELAKGRCAASLPSYMLPSHWCSVEHWPLTTNGKIDSTKLPLPLLKTTGGKLQLPVNDAEKVLHAIWAKLLNVDPETLSIDDNFFELGGDSILSIQMVSAVNKKRFNLSVNEVFEDPTIRTLAEKLSISSIDKSMSIDDSSELYLMPIAHDFAQDPKDLHHFNQSASFEIPHYANKQQLTSILEEICRKHSVFKSSFHLNSRGLSVMKADIDDRHLLKCVYHCQSNMSDFSDTLPLITDLQRSFVLSEAPLIRFIFASNNQGKFRLTIIVHHFVIDGVSWRILADDLEILLKQIIAEETLELKSSSNQYYQAASILVQRAKDEAFKSEAVYWIEKACQEASLIADKAEAGSINDVTIKQVVFNESLTKRLLTNVNKAFNTTISEVLLSALVLTLKKWRSGSDFKVNFEGHGRQYFHDKLDLHDTIGWFSSVYPLVFTQIEDDFSATINKVKAVVRDVPEHGIGYGISKFLTDYAIRGSFKNEQPSQVLFNYLGQIDQLANSSLLNLVDANLPGNISQNRSLTHPLTINGFVSQEKISFNLGFNSKLFSEHEQSLFEHHFKNTLSDLIVFCCEQAATQYSSVDFPLCQFNENELLQIQNRVTLQEYDISNIYPATKMQEGLLLKSELQPGTYCSQLLFTLSDLDCIDSFVKAWTSLVQRYDIFKTQFYRSYQGDTYQVVQDNVKFNPRLVDLSESSAAEQEVLIQSFIENDRAQGFDASEAPLMRVVIWHLGNSNYRVLWSHHHALIDGWCLSIIFNELSLFYQNPTLATHYQKPTPYSDYIGWLGHQTFAEELNYWADYLSGITHKTSFLVDQTKASMDSVVVRRDLVIDSKTTAKIKKRCSDLKITLNSFLQSALGYVLARYTNQTRVCFGATVSGRPAELIDSDKIVGLFINTIPVVVDIGENQTVQDWLSANHNSQLTSLLNSHLPLVEILGQAPKHLGTDFFDLLFVFENYPIDSDINQKLQERGINVSTISNVESTGYGLTVNAQLDQELRFDFCGEITTSLVNMLEGFIDHLHNFLDVLVNVVPDTSLNMLSMVSEKEQTDLVRISSGIVKDFDHSLLIQERFEQQVERTPNNIAVVHYQKTLTYSELNSYANAIANRLRALGIVRNSLVGIHAHRSMHFLAAILGILKAGGCYVPLDVKNPLHRIQFMVEDAQLSVVLTDDECMTNLSGVNESTEVLSVEHFLQYAREVLINPSIINEPDDLAYMLYTSGSTGKPKGALVHHAGAINHIDAEFYVLEFMDNKGNLKPKNFLQSAASSSDVSVWQFLAPLFCGAKTVIIDNMIDITLMHHEIVRNNVHLVEAAPSVLQEYVKFLKTLSNVEKQQYPLDWMMTIAEPIPVKLVNEWLVLFPNIPIMNGYGPTEASDDITEYIVRERLPENLSSVPIGRPLPNTNMYVLSHHNQLQPVGIPGQLAVSGVCVGKGYLNNPNKTKLSFIENKLKNSSPGHETLYLTGDLGYWDDQEQLVLTGRIDNQVKVRGHRVELSEIEGVLVDEPTISEVVVLINTSHFSEPTLVAYLIHQANSARTDEQLNHYVRRYLPEYMLPSAYVRLDRMPLNIADKIDRKRLAQISISHKGVFTSAQTAEETQLRQIFSQILGKPEHEICTKQSLFNIGGHSLHVIKIIAEIKRVFKISLSAKDVFDNPSICVLGQKLSQYLKENNGCTENIQEDFEEFSL